MARPGRNRPSLWGKPVPRRDDVRFPPHTTPRPAEPSFHSPAGNAITPAPFSLPLALEALRTAWNTERDGRRKSRLKQIESWFWLANHLRNNRDDLVLFARQSEFANFKGARPSIDKPDEVLRHVIRFDFGFGGDAKRAASRYTNALEPAFKAGITADRIANHIVEQGGINKMASANVKTRRSAVAPTLPAITLKLEAGEVAQRLLDMEPGQHAKLGVEILGRAGRSATVRLRSVRPRKSPKRTE